MYQENFIYKTLLIGSLVLIFCCSFIFINQQDNDFNIRNMLIIGCQLTNEESIKNQLSYLNNKSILSINNQEIREKLLNNQFISETFISLILPNTIIIKIKEITHISLLNFNNKTFLIDNNNNGFYCSSVIFDNIDIPKLIINNIDNQEMVFDDPSYYLLNSIHSKNIKLFHLINNIENNNEKIKISLKNNGYIEFNVKNHIKQLEYLSAFFNSINIYNSLLFFEYIKFKGENIIIKGTV